MTVMNSVICEWETEVILGEGPLWVARESALYWVDIIIKRPYGLVPASDERKAWTFDTELTSLAGRTLYHTDNSKRTTYALDLDNSGGISNKRVFDQLTDETEGYPDGMTVDGENCLWLCHFAGARDTRFSPAGDILQVIPIPAPNITSCTFGGPKLDTLYITSARLH